MTTNDSIEIRNDLKTILDRGAHLPYIEFCDGKYSFFAMDCCHSTAYTRISLLRRLPF